MPLKDEFRELFARLFPAKSSPDDLVAEMVAHQPKKLDPMRTIYPNRDAADKISKMLTDKKAKEDLAAEKVRAMVGK